MRSEKGDGDGPKSQKGLTPCPDPDHLSGSQVSLVGKAGQYGLTSFKK